MNSSTAPTAPITIRPAFADDDRALARLAALDSAPIPPPAPVMLAEVDGELRAALSLEDGSAIADPFAPTGHLIELLRAHAHAMSNPRPRGRRARAHPFSIGTLTRLPHSVHEPS
jgi:hypothetical protein